MNLSFIGIIVGVAFFMYSAYKGYNIFFNVLVASAIIFITDGMNPFTGWTTVFMPAFAKQATNMVLIYVLSAIFAAQMAYSGAAKALAVKISRALKRNAKTELAQKFFAVATMPITCAILTYGGVSSLMLTFIIVALFKEMFKEMDIPWEYYCFASIGTATFGTNKTEWTAKSTKKLDYFITAGDSPAELEEQYSAATGRSPMMPEYGLGYWQCKLRYRTQEEILAVAR